MTLFDTRLPDPTAKVVHATITDAFRAVSKYGIAARIPHSKISMKRVADRAAAEPEGVDFWASRFVVATGVAGQVVVAWWTAVSGRRHVRVTGRLVTPGTSYLLNAAKLSTRPAVWHVFPDRVYRRRIGKVNDLVGVCGCGAIGTEKALGWAGACCGPCADYRDEHGTLPWKRPALLATPTPCLAVAASANGRWAAGACADRVLVWDLDAGADPVATFAVKAETDILPHVALSPGGDYLAVAGVIYDGLRVIALREDAAPTVVHQFLAIETAAFHPARTELYSVASGRMMVAAPPEARPRELAIPAVEHGGPLVFSRDGARLAVRRNQQICIHERGGKSLAALALPQTRLYRTIPAVGAVRRALQPHVAFSPDGGQIAIGYDQALGVYHAVTGEQRFVDSEVEAQVSGVAFDPGGKWLYVGRRDGTLVAYHTDTFAPERSVVFRWSLGPIHALAACGDSLLAACDEGAQLWPMGKLLEGV
jgi:hypothetical protein